MRLTNSSYLYLIFIIILDYKLNLALLDNYYYLIENIIEDFTNRTPIAPYSIIINKKLVFYNKDLTTRLIFIFEYS